MQFNMRAGFMGSDEDDSEEGFMMMGKKDEGDVKKENRIREFHGQKIAYIKRMFQWCYDHKTNSVFNQRYKRAPKMPLMYRDCSHL